MYAVPETPSLTYGSSDTTNVSIEAGPMGTLRMRGTSTATVAVEFARGEGGVQVTARLEKLEARMSNPMGGAQTATEADMAGDIVFVLDRRGRPTVVTVPEVKAEIAQLVNPYGFVYEFFPRLPGGVVQPGESWTDTIRYEVSLGEAGVTSSTVMTYTLVGDTVVDGQNLLVISMTGDAEVVASGVTQGMDVSQSFSGTSEGVVLWDPVAGVMVSAERTAQMSGSVDVPAAGMPPMPMRVKAKTRIWLQR